MSDKKDAARYRFIKRASGLTLRSSPMRWYDPKTKEEFLSEHFLQANGTQFSGYRTLDELIDAAMKLEGEVYE